MTDISFDFRRVALQKGERGSGSQVVVTGEILNRSFRSFSAVSLRVCVRNGENTAANISFIVYGLPSGMSRRFSKSLDDLEYDKVVNLGTECECSVDSAF